MKNKTYYKTKISTDMLKYQLFDDLLSFWGDNYLVVTSQENI